MSIMSIIDISAAVQAVENEYNYVHQEVENCPKSRHKMQNT